MELTSPSITEPVIDESEDPLIKGQWQWKSNSNPWCKTEQAQWTSYPPKENYLIENAFRDKKEVLVGEYIVFPQDKLQKRKHNHEAQRPVRRVKQSEVEGNERSERYYQTENPKTVNKVFGTLRDFIHFISRSNEILEFTRSLEKAQQSKDIDALNQKILPQLAACIREELRNLHSREPKTDSLSPFQIKHKEKVDARNQELILMFEKQLSSFDEFHGCVLKAYTMNTFLYQNLNQYLRNEDWIALDRLSPYLLCLCKAFFIHKTKPIQDLKEIEDITILYRGTALDEEALSHYNVKNQRNFSWNAVTSTTTNLSVAENFMYLSVDQAKRKYPVLFIIEVPSSLTELGYLGHLEVKSYSAKPQEDEVILPPGSIFELQEVSKIGNDETRIVKLQLKSDFKMLDYRGVVMHGAKQNAMIKDQKAYIYFQKKRHAGELLETLKALHGNPLIEEIEFDECEFTQDSVKTTISTLASMRKLKRIEFLSCRFLYTQHEPNLKFESIFTCESTLLEETPRTLKSHFGITSLSFKVPTSQNITDNGVIELCKKGLKNLTQLKSLKIDLSYCYCITDVGVQALVQEGLENLTQLEFLEINVTKCLEVSDKSFSLLDQGLANLVQLNTLNLNISKCFKIKCQAIHDLCIKRLKLLPKLESLSLDFWWKSRITYEEIHDLTLEKFQHLKVHPYFSNDEQSMNDKVSTMCLNGLRHLTELRSLSLSWTQCRDINNDGIQSFAREGISHLLQLTSLSLDFSGCAQITDIGFSNFSKEGLKHLTQLTSLNLDFSDCSRITANRFSDFRKEGLKNLTQLTSLRLNFARCFKITGEEFKELCIQISNHLTDFKLDFWWHHQITLEDFPNVFSQKINNLTLSPERSETYNINDDIRMRKIRRDEFLYLTHFVELDLNLSDWRNLSDQGVLNLCTEWLSHLKDLTSLNLNFSNCHEITDEGIQALSTQGLHHLTSLTSLKLNFSGCPKITGEGIIHSFSRDFERLPRLKILKLDFSKCKKITYDTIKQLSERAFKTLLQLENVDLLPSAQDDLIQGEWQRQSNFDPFDPLKEAQWISYSPEQNYLIEKAFLKGAKEIDLDGYTISLKEMRQMKKDGSALHIPVRRIMPVKAEEKNSAESNISRFSYPKEPWNLLPRKNPPHLKVASQNGKGMWQWESDSGWEFYSFDHNERIEEAFHQDIEIQIKEFWISPISLTQTEKANSGNKRRIRRIVWIESKETESVLEKQFEREQSEKMNEIFGNLSDFIIFLKNIEKGDFTRMFEEIEAANNVSELNDKIVPQIQICFQNEVDKSSLEKPSESIISCFINKLEAQEEFFFPNSEKIDAIKNILRFKMEKQCRELTRIFQQSFENFPQFYACIIKAYKMNTFLYQNLNKYLRNENWHQLHFLLPYLFCICKAFFGFKKGVKVQVYEEQRAFTLYRGTRLDQDELNRYDPESLKYFSWNSITSTTANIEVANEFAHSFVNEKDKIFPVLFFITIPEQVNELEYLRYLDVNFYSDVSKRGEIISTESPKKCEFLLPPGSLFELQSKFFDENTDIIIFLELKSN